VVTASGAPEEMMKHNINIGNDILKNTDKNQFTRNKKIRESKKL
jgi:hypothetical protein